MESTINSGERPSVATHPTNSCSRLKTRDWLKLISNLVIPLIIGVFTIFIAIQQQNVGQANRDKDVARAAELRKENLEKERLQREEDKELARLQREEDKKMARRQRDEDKETARLQREENKEIARRQRDEDKETARLQRELDFNIEKDKRIQESELADKQRNLSESQRAHEFEIAYQNHISNLILADDRQKENVLINYQRQLTKLLLEYQSLLNVSRVTFLFVLRMRTRAALKSLNPTRRTILVRTLRQAGLLEETWGKEKPLLYQVNVSSVHFGQPPGYNFSSFLTKYNRLDIEHADLRYASFRSVSFKESPSFTFSNLDFTDWSFAQFEFISFHNKMTMNDAVFDNSYLKYVTFGNISMNRVSFQNNIQCDYCVFNGTSLLGARLDHSTFLNSRFLSVSMIDVNMSNSYFSDTIFENATLDRVDLSGANIQLSSFDQVSMVNCSMFGTNLIKTDFSDVNTWGCKV